ncbi:xanthine dehydrogenase family protein molybdopterin-binding subunit [Kordiimonas aquimaris]|uniref:xanthine dehydrogenase family protein molybdopterin-binding subunit n=1 Tax=Kordiimonas aquimaris TaxID=707591 RepID=UPI0021D13D8F|nr:molybdopterin cofactor-binding domain-containing protein [Kordiimonas aquimaris]
MTNLSRRTFIKSGAGLASFAILVSANPRLARSNDTGHITDIGPCLRFSDDGSTVLCVPTPDMGQGIMTAAAQVIAEEMDIDLNAVSVEFMPFIGIIDDEGIARDKDLTQGAGGSHSMMDLWPALRKTAAYSRALLVEAAAQKWGIDASKLSTLDGHVIDAGGRKLAYKDLVATVDINLDQSAVTPKPIKDYKVIGKDARNVAALDIVTGKPVFSLDVDVPGTLHAVIRRCPHLIGKVKSYNEDEVASMEGVKAVVKMDQVLEEDGWRTIADGVAIIADTYWHARQAADALTIEWDGSAATEDDTNIILDKCEALTKTEKLKEVARNGNPEEAFNAAAKVIDVTYTHPSWAHACIEPHNCTAHVNGNSAEVWVGHQNTTRIANIVKRFADVDAANVNTHMYRMGTGFGRKYVQDFVAEAVMLSKKMQAPVKVTWSREDEIEQDYPNHMGAYRVKAAIDKDDNLSGWHIKTALDTGRDWVAKDFPTTAVANSLGEVVSVPNNISHGAWRGPSHNTGAWVVQSALSEAAYAAGKDPYDFLIALYGKSGTIQTPDWPNMDVNYDRHVALLEKVALASEYGKEMPDGWGQGIAVHHTFVSACAHVVDLEMIGDNDYRVHKVTSAIDCGLAVNPLGIRAQVESGIMDGLCAAKYGKLVFEAGVPITNNFDTYQKMRIDEAPPIVNIHIMDFGDTEPRGTGEVSLPPIIPALTNAIFAASGKRIRSLPISESLETA